MKTFELRATSNADLFRVVDLNGDWTHYYHKPSGKYLRAVNFIIDRGFPKGDGLIRWLKSNTAEEIERKLRFAGDRGDAVHQAIKATLSETGGIFQRGHAVLSEDDVTPRQLTHDEWGCLLSWAHFWNVHKCELISCEETVCNLTLNYAGTRDAVLIMRELCGVKTCGCRKDLIGVRQLIDWKTGAGLYKNYELQIAAYAKCPPTETNLHTALLRVGTSHVKTNGYEYQVFDPVETQHNFDLFKFADQLASVDYKPFDPEKEIQEIPDSITIQTERSQSNGMEASESK